jgi:hypothetical protein
LGNHEGLFIKHNEITFVDRVNKKVFKRIFKSNINFSPDPRDFKQLSPLLEVNKVYSSSYDFVFELVEGEDIYMQLLNNKDNQDNQDKILKTFDDFLAKWLNHNPNCDYLETLSADLNAGNFIMNSTFDKITLIDYMADWGLTKKPLCLYLRPYVYLLKYNILEQSQVELIIEKRFEGHKLRPTFESLLNQYRNEIEMPDISNYEVPQLQINL